MPIDNNPFDAQPPAPQQPAPTGLVSGSMSAEAYRPATRTIDPVKGTVQGQVESILSKDGALMQRARTTAQEQMASRGLLNSSMAVEAGQAAVLDRALPMAQQDAAAHNQMDGENMSAVNSASQFNTGARNQSSLQAQQIASSEKQQAQQLAQQGEQFKSSQAQQGEQFKSAQEAQFKLTAQQHANDLERLGVQNNFATAQVPQQFAAGVAASTADRVNAILSDPNLKPEAKRAAVENITTYANATIAWAEKLYNVDLPNASAPQPLVTSKTYGG
jgi:hypothetical protein